VCMCVSVCTTFQRLNHLTNFHEICYECYPVGGKPNLKLFHTVVITQVTWREYELVRGQCLYGNYMHQPL
jgi:hypothetical protein